MRVETAKLSDNEMQLTFTLKGAGIGFANAVRRISMGQVPVFAIDAITIYENTSAFFDEYIATRIGLIPIKTPEGYTPEDEIIFKFSAEGPGVAYSKDLTSTDRSVSCASKKIPIIELADGQVIRLEGRARLGRGREHGKFQPCLCSYGHDDKNGEFKFTLESFGQMPAPGILMQAAELLAAKCENFLALLEKK